MTADAAISDREFGRIRDLLYHRAGITLSDNKKALVTGRLQRRLSSLGLDSYTAYLAHIESAQNEPELRQAIDLLTTNETYFWREPAHFQRLADEALKVRDGREWRIWSAACSSGEEVYTIAMVLQQLCEQGARLNWSVLGTDLSERMLQKAVKGHYPLDRAQRLPEGLLKRFCLRGTGQQDGTLLIERELRRNITFGQVNLVEPLPDVGMFDIIFLRNVLIYFDTATKAQVIRQLTRQLRPGGLFIVGLAESLNGVVDHLQMLGPGVHQRPVQQ